MSRDLNLRHIYCNDLSIKRFSCVGSMAAVS